MSLLDISRLLTIHVGFILLLAGILGNGMNILIFSSTRDYRKAPCTFFFLIGSINNTIHLLFNLTITILGGGYTIDLNSRSIVICKIRPFLFVSLAIISFACPSFAAIDQFFVTSRSVSIRRYSNIKWARRTMCIMTIVWCLVGVPYFVYYDISNITQKCDNTNATHRDVMIVILFIFLCVMPVLVMLVFGYLTYRNIHQTRVLVAGHADRQMTKMTLMQVALAVVSIIPFASFNAYDSITANAVKDINQQIQEHFAATIISLISYIHFAGSFYVLLISSSRFRQRVKTFLCWWQRTNQINAIEI